MIDKINVFKQIFPKLILKKHKVNKNKRKAFIIFSNNNTLNWILFRNIIPNTHYHFQIEPLLFVTDSIGFEEISDTVELNPYNPTFNILTKIDETMEETKLIHTDIKGIKYTIWWDGLDDLSKRRTNLFCFSDSKEELNKMVKIFNKNGMEVVIFYLYTDKNEIKIEEELKKEEIWLLKVSKNILKVWEDKTLFNILKEKINFRKHRKLKKVRNQIFSIMNEYYKQPVVPSYYNDEDKFMSSKEADLERIKFEYE